MQQLTYEGARGALLCVSRPFVRARLTQKKNLPVAQNYEFDFFSYLNNEFPNSNSYRSCLHVQSK